MIKQELHDLLTNIKDTLIITVDNIIEIYGDDKRQVKLMKVGKREVCRADVLAQAHGLNVIKEGDNYIFSKD